MSIRQPARLSRTAPRRGDNREVKTLRLAVDPANLTSSDAQDALDRAAAILRAGGLVALPTETVYGLGANALDASAVASIFAAKQRPAWDPIIVHVSSIQMLEALVAEASSAARKLMQAFWPGPLTLLLPRSAVVPDAVTAGRPLVGVRMPAHPVALELIRRAAVPIAAPSANVFGHISPTTAAHVLDDLDGRIDAVVDAGPALHGVESTVLDPAQSPMVIYRPGAVTAAQIEQVAGAVEYYRTGLPLDQAPHAAMPSPGVGIRHYAPKARLILVESARPDPTGIEAVQALAELVQQAERKWPGERVGVLLPANMDIDTWSNRSNLILFRWGRWSDPEELARNLYFGLRSLDAQDCSLILCPIPQAEGVGAAIRDRLRKAAHQGS